VQSFWHPQGSNAVDPVWRQIATVVAPEDPPPAFNP
jgi:hypothetical protein